jgi:nucleotide-binding universal stress UspA family protein
MDLRLILVPFDFSECADKAFRWALALAETWRCQLILCHVVSSPTTSPLVFGLNVTQAELAVWVQSDADANLREFIATVIPTTVRIDAHVALGEPFNEICRMAEEKHASLIVMGSHGRTGLSHVLIGSVAERVVRHASCPVLVVGKNAPPSS